MKPVLIVEGQRKNIVSAGIETEQGETKLFYSDKKYSQASDVLNFAETIENPAQQQKYVEDIQNEINGFTDYLQDLKNQIANTIINNKKKGLPFIDVGIESIAAEAISQEVFIEGLKVGLDIVKGGRKWDLKKVVSEVSSTDE